MYLGSKVVITKLVTEVLKLEEQISNLMAKLIVMDGKIDSISKPVESQTSEREIDPEFLSEPLKEIEDVRLLEVALLDNDKYYQLVRQRYFYSSFIDSFKVLKYLYSP